MRTFCSFLFLAGFLCSCNHARVYDLAETKKSSYNNFGYIVDTLVIEIADEGMPYYHLYNTFIVDNNLMLAGYNRKTHAFDFYNINKKEYDSSIPLAYQGPYRIFDIVGFYPHTIDSIFVLAFGGIYLINSEGQVKNILSTNKLKENPDYENLSFFASSGFNLFYDKVENLLFLNCRNAYNELFSDEFYSQPILSSYNLNTEEIFLYPFGYSGYFKENQGKYGYFNLPNLTIHSGRVVYNFPAESNIYTYDLNSGDFSVHGGKSKFSQNTVTPIFTENRVELDDHFLMNPYFFRTEYDPYRKLYYRIHRGDIPLKKNSNEYNTYFDKENYLMVFDSLLNLIEEVKLGNEYYLFDNWYIGPEGLYITVGNPMQLDLSKNQMVIHRYEFTCQDNN